MEDGRVVVEADPDALSLDQLCEPVLLERERRELVQRVSKDPGDHDDHREDQEVRNRRLRDALGARSPPRPVGRGLGGDVIPRDPIDSG